MNTDETQVKNGNEEIRENLCASVAERKRSRLLPLDLARFLDAKVEQKDTFVCGSNRGCGGAGNHCRIERLRTLVNDRAPISPGAAAVRCTTKARERKNCPTSRRTRSASARNWSNN